MQVRMQLQNSMSLYFTEESRMTYAFLDTERMDSKHVSDVSAGLEQCL